MYSIKKLNHNNLIDKYMRRHELFQKYKFKLVLASRFSYKRSGIDLIIESIKFVTIF